MSIIGKIKVVIIYPITAILLICILLYSLDGLYGKYKNQENLPEFITFSSGDIIYKTTSYILAGSKYPHYGSLPGHLGIVLSDTTLSITSNHIDSILIAESSLFKINERRLLPTLAINLVSNNYSHAKGRLFIIKTNLNNSEKKKLKNYINLHIGKPYNLFANKNDTTQFNCATFVWSAFKYSAGLDIDHNRGDIVFPADILNYFSKERGYNRVRF